MGNRDEQSPLPVRTFIDELAKRAATDLIPLGHSTVTLDEARLAQILTTFGQVVAAQAEVVAAGKPVAAAPTAQVPVPLLLHCPECRARHVDTGEFETKAHHTHACQKCGHVWRPGAVNTVGVQFLPGFKNDPPVEPSMRGCGKTIEIRGDSFRCGERIGPVSQIPVLCPACVKSVGAGLPFPRLTGKLRT